MASPLVTIAIPTYNRPLGLKKAVESALRQSYENIEIIVSDNHSSIESVEALLSSLEGHDKISVYRQETNVGAYNNFNFLLPKVNGNYFLFLADDDWLEPNFVSEAVKFLDQNEDFISVHAPAKFYSAEDDRFLHDDKFLYLTEDNVEDRIIGYLQSVTLNSAYYGVRRRSALSFSSSSSKISDDWMIMCRLLRLGKATCLDGTGMNFTAGGSSRTADDLVRALGSHALVKSFPLYALAWNHFFNILFHQAFQDIPIFTRLRMARRAYLAGRRKWRIKGQLKKGLMRLLGLRDSLGY